MAEITLNSPGSEPRPGRAGSPRATAAGRPLPFREAIAFFRQKTPMPSATWTDFWQEKHDSAFVVAGAMRQELVDDFFTTIDRLRGQSKGYGAFLQEFDRIVAQHGWQYNGSRGWRSRVIWRTNMRTSYQAGRYRQMKEVSERRPYWEYHHSDFVADPRPHHVALDGTILPHDHPFWDTHYPPNGWGCQCYVTAHSRQDLEREGRTVSADPQVRWEDVTVGSRGPRPQQIRVPEGIDPGWAYAPGKSWVDQAVKRAAVQMDTGATEVATTATMAAAHRRLLERWLEGDSEADFPLAVLPDADATRIHAKSRVVLFSRSTMGKQLAEHPEIRPADYARAQAVIMMGQRIQDSERSLVFVHETDHFVMVVKATKTGLGLFLTSFRRLSSDDAKRSRELRRLLNRGKE